MSLLVTAYGVMPSDVRAVSEAVSGLRLTEKSALRQIAKALHQHSGESFPEGNVQAQFDALVIKLGQRLREIDPDLAEFDDEAAWKRLAIAYAYATDQE